MEADVVRVFLLPPSIEELEQRLRSRATDPDDVIKARMARARAEISHWDGYDYVVVNDDIDACFETVRGILESERLRRTRQTGLIDFVRDLTRERLGSGPKRLQRHPRSHRDPPHRPPHHRP